MRKNGFVLFVAAAALYVLTPAQAELEKNATIDCAAGEICFHIWPKLPAVPGWHTDEDMNYGNEINTLVPDGSTFADAETVIYAAASQARQPGDTLDSYIEKDKAGFLAHDPGGEITEVEPLTTADGRKLRVFKFTKLKNTCCEFTAYGEEEEFFIVFVVSSKSEKGLGDNLDLFKKIIAGYKK